MQLGVVVEGQEGLTWEHWRRVASTVEALGFESLWRSDHLLSRLDEARAALDTWTSLAVAAAETSVVRLGPLVCPMTFRHPSLLAKAAAAVDQLSGGRLELGVGAGWNAREHAAFGLPFPPIAERVDRLVEGIQVIEALWSDGPATFDGRYYQVNAPDVLPKPVQRPRVPLVVGGKGERRTLPVVARFADEWNLTTSSAAVVRAKSAVLRTCCAAIGRDAATIRRSVAAGFIVAGSERELARRCAVMRRIVPDLAPFDEGDVPAAAREIGWLCGTPDDLIRDLRVLAAEGVQRAMLGFVDWSDVDALRLIAREVLPAVSGAGTVDKGAGTLDAGRQM